MMGTVIDILRAARSYTIDKHKMFCSFFSFDVVRFYTALVTILYVTDLYYINRLDLYYSIIGDLLFPDIDIADTIETIIFLEGNFHSDKFPGNYDP